MFKEKKYLHIVNLILLIILILSFGVNQFALAKTNQSLGDKNDFLSKLLSLRNLSNKTDEDKSLETVDLKKISSTAQSIAALFPLDKAETPEDVMAIMIPTGIPEYGEEMGISYDEPAESIKKMAKAYNALKKQAQDNPAVWERYIKLAAAPRGISCEFCCGVGPQGIDEKGNLRCGCKHNSAMQTITLWLMQNTDYNDAKILKEAMKWKTLFFPRDMVGLASKISGGDEDVLKDLPGMVGGC